MKKKRGRPKRRGTLASATVLPTRAKRGRPTTEREAAKKSRQKAKQNTVPSPPLPNTNKRVNHSNDENFIRAVKPFKEWCIRIQDMLQVGECFKNEDQDVDVYLLLPRWWHAMEPDDKKKAMAIYDQHKSWTVRCCQELQEKCVIPKMELQNLRVCIECALKDPSHLDRELPTKEELEAKLINPEVTAVPRFTLFRTRR